MGNAYDPSRYWETRLRRHTGLRGVGHISFSESYNRRLYAAKSRTLERVLDGQHVGGKSVLDVGCGTGYFVDWYMQRGAIVSGVDIAAQSIEQLRARAPGDYRVIDISSSEATPSGQYDVVNVWDVLYHVVSDDGFEQALRFLASSVAAGGLMVISDRLAAHDEIRPSAHVRMRNLAAYRDKLAAQGLELQGLHFLYRWLNRYVSIPLIDNWLSGFYYWLDARETEPCADNLCVGLWRRITSS